MSTPEVLLLGETMMSLRSPAALASGRQLTASIAGAESNVAIGLARLGHRTAWLGRVGSDSPGDLVLRTLRAEGVDVSAVRRDAAPTGIITFEQRLPGVQRVSYARAASAGSRLAPSDVTVPADTRVVHLSGITAALGEEPRAAVFAAAEQARSVGALVSVDLNFRRQLWGEDEARLVLGQLAAIADVLIGSPEELALLDGSGVDDPLEIARQLVTERLHVVVKDGAEGARVIDHEGLVFEPARRIELVDAVGAGDAFVAGYLSGLLDGSNPTERLRRAHTMGAFAASTVGDWEGLPTRDELALLDHSAGTVLR